MLHELMHLWDTLPRRAFAIILKSKHRILYEWVLVSTDSTFSTFNERVFWLLHPIKLMCNRGNRLKFIQSKNKYGFCNSPNKCVCHREAISVRMLNTSVFNTVEFSDNRKIYWQEKYGVDNPQKLDSYKRNASERVTGSKHSVHALADYSNAGFSTVVQRVSNKVRPLFTIDEYAGSRRKHKYRWQCVSCNNTIVSHIDYGTVPRCTKCYPVNVSLPEKELRTFLHTLEIPFITNTRNIIAPLELDMFIPTLNIAIEFNGSYWHSDNKKQPTYHLQKFLKCNTKGIRLIQIFEDEWCNKQQIVKSRLRNILGADTQIHAGKCIFEEVSASSAMKFADLYNISGYEHASIHLGLYYTASLHALMTFSEVDGQYMLVQYCSKYTIIGGPSKLFNRFINLYSPSSVFGYADRNWSSGDMYLKLGFENVTVDNKNTNTFYIVNGIRCSTIDKTLPYLKLHGCGRYTFVYRLTV